VHPWIYDFSMSFLVTVFTLGLLKGKSWEDKSNYLLELSGKRGIQWTLAARNSSCNFKAMDCIIPAQTGLASRRLASKVKGPPQVYETHSYLEIHRTHLYLQSIKNDEIQCPTNLGCILQSPGKVCFTNTNPRFNLPDSLI
jgi:hypothetical protein